MAQWPPLKELLAGAAATRWRNGSPLKATGLPCCAGSLSPRSSARTSDSRNLRCPPGVRMLVMRPEAAQRVTVFGSTRNRAATSPGVSRRSLLPSTFSPLRLSPSYLRSGDPPSLALNEYFLPRFLEISLRISAPWSAAQVGGLGWAIDG